MHMSVLNWNLLLLPPSSPHTLTPSHPLTVLLSGLNLGSSWSDQLSVELLVDYITGQLGEAAVGVACGALSVGIPMYIGCMAGWSLMTCADSVWLCKVQWEV